jgi:hypothetical protein
MTSSCPVGCNDITIRDIHQYREECVQANYNIICTLCGIGVGFGRKSACAHENGRKHKAEYAREKERSQEHKICTALNKEAYQSNVLNNSLEVYKFRASKNLVERLAETKVLVCKPWASTVKGVIWDWEHNLVGLSEITDACELVAFKEIMCLVQLGFIKNRLHYIKNFPQDRVNEISRLLASDGHIIMNRIYQFLGTDFPWLLRCIQSS